MIPKSTIPEGICGNWRVKKFTVNDEAEKFGRLRAMVSFSSHGRYVPAGTYTGLYRGNMLVMSDTPDELHDHFDFVRRSRGSILINGLGLGVCLAAVLAKPEVTSVLVIEIAPEVLHLVGSHFHDDRLQLIRADALTYQPERGARFDAVWHDIWDNVCADNLDEMKRLHRRYARRTGWQGSWCRGLVERLR